MSSLGDLHFSMELDEHGKRSYVLKKPYVYYSPRFKKYVTCETGFASDGATGAIDVVSRSWWTHDKVCETLQWDDGSPCGIWQSSWLLTDILWEEKQYIRAPIWGTLSCIWRGIKYGYSRIKL